ncbi:hypothetical protein LguiA_030609 [Lonicera macranthoides]
MTPFSSSRSCDIRSTVSFRRLINLERSLLSHQYGSKDSSVSKFVKPSNRNLDTWTFTFSEEFESKAKKEPTSNNQVLVPERNISEELTGTLETCCFDKESSKQLQVAWYCAAYDVAG